MYVRVFFGSVSRTDHMRIRIGKGSEFPISGGGDAGRNSQKRKSSNKAASV